ncbi:MAG: FtsK/SpoIIIE domain-containing protein [Bdellovibrionota bacterium]
MRNVLGIAAWFCGFYGWGVYRLFARRNTQSQLNLAFTNAGLETRLKETPVFQSDYPIDEFARKLTLRSGGIPLSAFKSAKDYVESNLNINISKMENPNNNKEFIDIIYTTVPMPEGWVLDNIQSYKDFSFPIGRSFRGEVTASLKEIPHFLVAGESGSGKSTFIRTMLTTLLANNLDLTIYYLDFKAGMENQVFEGFDNLHTVDSTQDAANKMDAVGRILETRMLDFKQAKSRNIEMYNKRPNSRGHREKRILVVVDEVAELMPTFGGKTNPDLAKINAVLGRISRMGRAVGISLVIGVQKPDTKNLDPTIKANLSGILCFSVSHFTQSTVVLGNDRAAHLPSNYKGRGIWKHGLEMVEVQTPLLTEEEIADVRERIDRTWGKKKDRKEFESTIVTSQQT